MKPEGIIFAVAFVFLVGIASYSVIGSPGAGNEFQEVKAVNQQAPLNNAFAQNQLVFEAEQNQGNAFNQQNNVNQQNNWQQDNQWNQANNGNNFTNAVLKMQNIALNPQAAQLEKQQTKLNIELINTLKLSEAHWQGMELMTLTTEVKQKLKYPMDLEGLLIDEVTLNSLVCGLLAGDVLLSVDGVKVDELRGFQRLTKKLRNNRSAKLKVWRKGEILPFKLRANDFLGITQAETAPMIVAGAIMPHPYRGACTDCHLIGSTGHMVPAPDAIILPPPAIPRGAKMPHRNFGPCESCHVVF
ncbi:MAG: PDZ domain-containing protein [Nitrospinae bacterium]|nr:PDZ domain-containing protein [Nitrospinota bacterium]